MRRRKRPVLPQVAFRCQNRPQKWNPVHPEMNDDRMETIDRIPDRSDLRGSIGQTVEDSSAC